MLEALPEPFLGSKAHRFYVRILVVVRCSALVVSSSDQETNLVLQIASGFSPSKQFYLTWNPS